jgi:hypothetical protein
MIDVVSFYVDRRADFPAAPDYIPLLHALERSCTRLGFNHVVLTDFYTAQTLTDQGFRVFARELPKALSNALTEVQAQYLEALPRRDTLFVGADCLIVRDFRAHLAAADLAIILRPGHKKHRINNGFMYVPAASVAKVAPLFRTIARTTGGSFNSCHDMVAVEAALAPMPTTYGVVERAGMTVNFLPMNVWNGGPKTADDPSPESFVLHFRGKERKPVMLAWELRWLR